MTAWALRWQDTFLYRVRQIKPWRVMHCNRLDSPRSWHLGSIGSLWHLCDEVTELLRLFDSHVIRLGSIQVGRIAIPLRLCLVLVIRNLQADIADWLGALTEIVLRSKPLGRTLGG